MKYLSLFRSSILAASTLFCAQAGPASAQSQALMMNECEGVAQTYFGDRQAQSDMRYNGQRVDGTHAINGRIFLETRAEDFACSYDRSGRRMTEFFAEGRLRNAYLPGGTGNSSGGTMMRVTGVPAGDVLNVRSGPGTSNRVVGALGNGDTVRRLTCQAQGRAEWCQIEMMTEMRERGWVNARYLTGESAVQLPETSQPDRTGEVVRVTGLSSGGILNVRSGPGTSFSIVGALTNGSTVREIRCNGASRNGWCQIEMMTDMRGRGWVSARYLTRGTAVQQPNPPIADSGSAPTVRVRFAPGTDGIELTGTLRRGETRRYLLNARNGQELYFRLAANGADMVWRFLNPDGSLNDQAPANREYRGSLWQRGDHVMEVVNRSGRSQTYNVIFGIR